MNRSSRCDEMTTKMESRYPSLDEVDVIPMPSLGEAFRYAERQRQQQQQQQAGEPDRPRLRPHEAPSSIAPRPSTSGLGPREKQPSAESSFPMLSRQSQKRPALQRLKSSDLLDTKPAAVMRPAATPGVVEVSHSPYFMHHQHHHQHQETSYGGLSSQASVASQGSLHAFAGGANGRARYHPSSSSSSAPAFPRMELEVSPGVFLPLHGSEETYAALRSDRLCATYCLACETPLFCVEYAAQVLCPNCRVVSPVFTHEDRPRHDDDSHLPPAGVGLGMTVDEYDRTWAEADERNMAARYGRGYHDRY